jgi:hypothetical protein
MRDPSTRTLAATLLVAAACIRAAVPLPANYRLVERADVDGNSVLDALVEDQGDCGSSGCRFWVLVDGSLDRRLLGEAALSCRLAPGSRTTYPPIDCVQRVGSQRVRAEVTYRFRRGDYRGDLDYLDEEKPPARCASAVAKGQIPILLLPALHVRVSAEVDGGFVRGEPETPRKGQLAAGERFIPEAEVTSDDGERWFRLGDRGWVAAVGVSCVEDTDAQRH